MKKKLLSMMFLSLLLLGMSNCKKARKINHTIRYTTDKNAFRMAGADSGHTGFGQYITSITPYSVKAKMNIMGYQDDWTSDAHQIGYINGHDNDPRFEIALYADFSNNAEIHPEPVLNSTDMWNGVFKQKQVTMTYFTFVPYYMNLEFEMPAGYGSTRPDMLDVYYDTSKRRYICKSTELNLVRMMWQNYPKPPGGYCFGNTDSTWIYNKEGLSLENSKDRPFGGPDYRQPVIRSNKFTPSTVTMSDGGETVEMVSTISFDTENIIQVYRGPDNMAYTRDDIFVYAPKYWERIKVKLSTQ